MDEFLKERIEAERERAFIKRIGFAYCLIVLLLGVLVWCAWKSLK